MQSAEVALLLLLFLLFLYEWCISDICFLSPDVECVLFVTKKLWLDEGDRNLFGVEEERR